MIKRHSRSKTKRVYRSKKRSHKKQEKAKKAMGKVLPVLPEDKQYNIYIICKNKKLFDERVASLSSYQRKIHAFHYVKAVFLKMTPSNMKKTEKLNTRYNTSMKARLRKLGCIYAHRNALRKIVKLKTNNNIILEEDATLDHILPLPPKQSAYLGGWIIPPQITLAGKKKIKIPHLKSGLNHINYDKYSVLMAHSYFVKTCDKAKSILQIIDGPEKIKNYDIFLIDHHIFDDFYYPAIFVQSRHLSDIDQGTNQNDLRTKDYGLHYTTKKRKE
jgi:hypothetical protein